MRFTTTNRGNRLRSRHGTSLLELSITLTIFSLLVTGAMNLIISINKSTDRIQTESGLVLFGRAATGEIFSELRAAKQVVPAATLNSVNYTTGPTSLVLTAPGINVADMSVILTGVTDTIAFTYDADAETLTETIVPGVGSQRPARANFRIARTYQYFQSPVAST